MKKAKNKRLGKEKTKQIKICPRCGSTNITWDYGNAWVIRFGVNRDWCNNCGLRGNFPTVNKTKVNEFRRVLKKTE